ncbi:hypothetical protein CAC42_831 [Sphaceloma murrayae]|uniref:Apple domain-containing protein n=1 Tax=Sphaceloma murrayae TaxID=2082308 RepID=A0A2K1QKW0_9PEZI|nr:hypothetical protein CAC42_831 [Sphaceloma murrayae]
MAKGSFQSGFMMLCLTILVVLAAAVRAAEIKVTDDTKHTVYVAAGNTSLDRHDLCHLRGTRSPSVLYSEQPYTGSILSTSVTTEKTVVLLEDSSRLASVTCSDDKTSLILDFTDSEAFQVAAGWSADDLVLVTRHAGCNPSKERGLFEVTGITPNSRDNSIAFTTTTSTWKTIGGQMAITMQTLERRDSVAIGLITSHEKRAVTSPKTCTVIRPKGYICERIGSLTNPARLRAPLVTANKATCRDLCLANPKCISFGYRSDSKLCALFTRGLREQGFTAKATAGMVVYNRRCFSCRTATTSKSASTSRRTSSTKTPASVSTTPSQRTPTTTSSTLAVTTTRSTIGLPSLVTTTSRLTSTIPGLLTTTPALTTTIIKLTTTTSTITTSTSTLPSTTSELTTTTSKTTTSIPIVSTVPTSSTTTTIDLKSLPVTLDEKQLAMATSILAAMTTNSAGYAMGTLSSGTSTIEVVAPTANAEDVSQQATLENELQKAGLTPFSTVFSQLTDILDTASGASSDASQFDTDESLVERSVELKTPKAKRALAKRGFWDDFLTGFKMSFCNEIVTAILEVAEGVCTAISSVETIICLATGCYKGSPKLPPVEYNIETTGALGLPGFKGTGYVKKTTNSVVSCPDCNMSLTNLKIKGTIVLDMKYMSLIDGTWDVSHDFVQNLDINVVTFGADQSSWSYAMSTLTLNKIEVSGVFTITPQLTLGFGINWAASAPAYMSLKRKVVLDGSDMKIRPFIYGSNNYDSWKPSVSTTEPTFDGDTTASMSAFLQSSTTLDIKLYGVTTRSMEITTSTRFGASGGLVTVAKAGRAPCPGGAYQVVKYTDTKHTMETPGDGLKVLFSQAEPLAPQCITVAMQPLKPAEFSAFAKLSKAGAFCTSLNSYTPSTVKATSTSVQVIPSVVITVTGDGTTTITPPAFTTTVTTTSSVVTSPASAPTARVKRSFGNASHAVAFSNSQQKGQLAKRAAIPTPIIVATWVPQQVTSACSRIATGATTSTSTTTTTTTSGTSTSTVQATDTAATPTSTSTSIIYVPASAPTDAITDKTFSTQNWLYTAGASRVCLKVSKSAFSNIAYTSCINNDIPANQSSRSNILGGSLAPQTVNMAATFLTTLTGLSPGWTYKFAVATGAHADSANCLVQYGLGEEVFGFFTPTTDWTSDIFPGKSSGLLSVVAARDTQVLSISMTCPTLGDDVTFRMPVLLGPYVNT